MFTMSDKYNDVMNSGLEKEIKMLLGNMLFSNECVTSLIPENAYDKTLQEIYDSINTPWGRHFPADEIMIAANIAEDIFVEKKWKIRPLWNEKATPVFDNTKESACLFTPVMNDNDKRPVMLLVPGGGYETISMIGEGFDLAKTAIEYGYRPYILRYRLKPNLFPDGQKDLALAILHIRANVQKDYIDEKDITIAGFSAGGHLCASMTTHAEDIKQLVLTDLKDNRKESYKTLNVMPEKMILGYAVTSFDKEFCEGLPDVCEVEERDYYSPLKNLCKHMPKTFCWSCMDDLLVPYQNSVCMDEGLRKAGVESKCLIYPSGGHGIAVGRGTSAEGWFEEMVKFMRA